MATRIFCILILGLIGLAPLSFLYAQKSTNDSLRAANKVRLEAAKAANAARRDSLENAREIERQKRALEVEERKAKQELMRRRRVAPLTQEMSVGFRLNSDGWSFLVNRGFIQTEAEQPHTAMLWFDISEKNNPKEYRAMNDNFAVVNPGEIKPMSYKYGKINNFYQVKIGYGNARPISGILDRKSVTVHWVYNAGLSLGLLKPYYLDILVPEGNVYVRQFAKYSEENRTSFLDLNNQGTIVGGSDFTRGISEIKLRPGLALRSGFYFDYRTSRKSFMGVEIGASAELYTQKIPIMVTSSSRATFFNFYADFRFGKRWE